MQLPPPLPQASPSIWLASVATSLTTLPQTRVSLRIAEHPGPILNPPPDPRVELETTTQSVLEGWPPRPALAPPPCAAEVPVNSQLENVGLA